jgi:hypothetical protein
MSRVRRLAIVLLTMGVITAAVYGTGAFSTLTAQRNADIQVAGDAASYLSIKPSHGPNGEYADLRGGKLRVSVGSALDGKGNGVNKNAVTVVRDIFTITNQGSQSVGLWITDKTGSVTFTGGPQETVVEGKRHAVTLNPGDTLSVGLTVDTRRANGAVPEMTAISIHADAAVAGRSVERRAADTSEQSGGSTTSMTQPSSERERTKQDKQSTKDRNKKSGQDNHKQSSDDGGLLSSAVNTVTDTVTGVGEYLYNTFSGFLKHAPGAVINKLRAAANHPLRAIWNAGKAVWNFFVGTALGGFGMPGGWFTAKEAKSPSYLIGWMAGTIMPGLDVATGVRDLVANLISGNTIGAVIEAIGLLPGLGALENVQDIYKVPVKWAKSFPTSADEAFQMIKGALLKNLPGLVREKIVKTFVDKPAKAKKMLKNLRSPKETALRLKKQYSLTDISKKEIATLKNDYGYSGRQMQKLLKQGGFSPDDLRTFAKHDIDIKRATKLGKEGYTADDIIFFSKHGEDTYPVRFSPTGKEDFARGRVGFGGPKTSQLVKLSDQGIPRHHVRYYVRTGVSLKAVSAIEKHVPGATPERIRRVFTAINVGQSGTTAVGKCRSTRAWIQKYEKRGEAELDRADKKILVTRLCE